MNKYIRCVLQAAPLPVVITLILTTLGPIMIAATLTER